MSKTMIEGEQLLRFEHTITVQPESRHVVDVAGGMITCDSTKWIVLFWGSKFNDGTTQTARDPPYGQPVPGVADSVPLRALARANQL